MARETMYITIRIDYEQDGRYENEQDAKDYAASKVIGDALCHTHTIENGIEICDIENCGENL